MACDYTGAVTKAQLPRAPQAWKYIAWLGVTFCALAANVGYLHPAFASATDSMALDLHFDSEEYAVDQPILFLVVLTNHRSEDIVDVAPLDPEWRNCTLEVEAGPAHERIQETLFTVYDSTYPTGGPTLSRGETACASGNLLRWFGSFSTGAEWFRQLQGPLQLAPGEYRVRALLGVHTDYSIRRGIPQVNLASSWSHFRVVPRTPEDDEGLETIRTAAGIPLVIDKGRASAQGRRARESLSGRLMPLTDLRFFHVAYAIGMVVGSNEPDLALIGKLRSGGRHVGAAWVLADQITRSQVPDVAKANWVARQLRGQKDSLQQIVLRSWAVMLAQRKNYTSFDPPQK